MYEVEELIDVREIKRTRFGRRVREFLVRWRGFEEPTWLPEEDLNCGALLFEFMRDRTGRNRFRVMQSED